MLPNGLVGIAGTGRDIGGKVIDGSNGVARQEQGGHLRRIQPFEGGIFQAAVVKIEAVDVEVGPHGFGKKQRPPCGGLAPGVETTGEMM